MTEQVNKTRSLFSWIVVGFFALFFAFDVWEGIGNFLGIQAQSLTLGIAISALGWVAIVVGVIAPIILFVLALLLSKKMSLGNSAFLFLLALAISAIISADLVLGTNAFLIYTVN